MKQKAYKQCLRCVMDNKSDNTITFDKNGFCNYCTYAIKRKEKTYFPNDIGKIKLEALIKDIKNRSLSQNYDCIMGVSGGLDSSYLLYLGYKWGLRILAFHIDDGFNTPVAEENIKKLCEKCRIDLIIERPDHDQFSDVTKAFFLAGLPGLCNVQDNLIASYLYKNAITYNIKTFLSGSNFALESILQRGDGINASDGFHIKSVADLYGSKGYNELPIMSIFYSYILTRYKYNLKTYRPLDLIEYNKKVAIKELEDFCGFNYYGGKHYESYLTTFNQVYYLPKKFSIDKRTSHLSSLIISNQIIRKEALEELKKPLYNDKQVEKIIALIIKKFNISEAEFDSIMKLKPNKHSDYPHSTFIKFEQPARFFRKYLNE
jgi:N-acetyl sugar amidotransferase